VNVNRKHVSRLAVLVLAMLAVAGIVEAQESKYASGTTSAAVTFGPGDGSRQVVKSVYATTDKEDGAVKIYARSGARLAPSSAPTASTNVPLSNATYAITNSDAIVYVHADGVLDYRTITIADPTYVYLSSALSQAGSTADRIYELSQQGEIVVGFDGANTGTNDTLATAGEMVFSGPGDSPLYLVIDGTAACKLTATVD